jgi:hypothetical protein
MDDAGWGVPLHDAEQDYSRRDELEDQAARRRRSGPYVQYGCAGRHHGRGTPDCPFDLHHHHDERCAPPAGEEEAR